MAEKQSELKQQFQEDFNAYSSVREKIEEKEKFIIGEIYDEISEKTRAQVVDQTLLTALIRRTNDVMARIPTGNVKVLSNADKGKGLLMNLVIKNYVLPNARSQYDFYTKLWLWEFLSLIFGKVDVLVDWVIKKGDYIGPDFYLIHPRHGIPQPNVPSIEDADYYWIITYVSPKWLETKKNLKGWKNIAKLLEKQKEGEPKTKYEETSYIEHKYSDVTEKGKFIRLVTKYEREKWTTFSPDYDIVVREIANPHQNGELPIVSKVCYPLVDFYYGLSEYDRGISLQKTINSLINLILDSQAKSLYPPLKVYLPDVVAKTLVNEPGAKWVLKNPNPNAITEMQFSPLPLNAFNTLYSTVKAALLSSLGTTDTAVSSQIDPAMGKTPEALKMQQAFMLMHTSFDRKMLELSIEKVLDKFIDLLVRKQDIDIDFTLFGQEIREIQKVYPDVVEMFDDERGKAVVKKNFFRDAKFKFFIDAGSTIQQDKMVENQTLTSILQLILKMPGAMEQITQTGKVRFGDVEVEFGEILKRWMSTSGIDGWDKIIKQIQPEQQERLNSGSQVPQGQTTQGQPPVGNPPVVNFENNPLLANLPEDQRLLAQEILGYGQSSNTNNS